MIKRGGGTGNGRVSHKTETKNTQAYSILFGMRPTVNPEKGWEENTKMDLGEKGLECVDFICLVHDVDEGGICEHGEEPWAL